MAESINPYYNKLLEDLNGGKDSIFEPARIESFDVKTLQAKVHGLRSKQTKENVTVLFPSFFMNSGIISFPVTDTIGMSFVGPDNETYFFPAQFFLPTKNVDNNKMRADGSPGQFDFTLSLENFEPGELLLRSLGQAQIFISNNGEIELLTKNLNRVALNDVDGSYEVNVEQTREFIGYSTWFKGIHESTNPQDVELPEQHIYTVLYEEAPDWDKRLVTELEVAQYESESSSLQDLFLDVLQVKNHPKYMEQRLNVYKESLVNNENRLEFTSEKIKSEVDGHPLFLKKTLYGTAPGDTTKNTRVRVEETVSQEGAAKRKLQKEEQGKTSIFESSVDHLLFSLTNSGKRITVEIKPEELSVTTNGTHLTIQESDVLFRLGNGGKQYSFNQLITRVNQISDRLDMSDL